MINLKNFKNLYEVRKTVRFWLNQPNKKWDFKTHLEFKNFTEKSFQNIENELASNGKYNIGDEEQLIKKISAFVEQLKIQLWYWKVFYQRYDLIAINKDYYKILARKAKFDAIWEIGKSNKYIKVKQPQASQISLSSLKIWNRSDSIIQYWWEIIEKTDYLLNIFKPKLEQYERAIKDANNAHIKPDSINFRKTFLQLLKLTKEFLRPLSDRSIIFEFSKKKVSKEIEKISEFAWEKNNTKIYNVLKNWEELRQYFEANWSQVSYWRVSLNYYTAVQKPNNFDQEIKKSIDDLWIINFLKKSDSQIIDYLHQGSKQKIKLLLTSKHPYPIELLQLFKLKPIPFSVKYNLAKFVEKNYKSETNLSYEDILNKFNLLWRAIDIANDFKNSNHKGNFSLDEYPVKLAFDYAWENTARSLKRDISFPKKVCERFLKDNFDIDVDNADFKLYANLLFIADNLATIEYNNPNNEAELINEIKQAFECMSFSFEKKVYEWHKKAILELLDKEKSQRDYSTISKAKQELWLLRWWLKNKIKKYRDLTQRLIDKKNSHFWIASFIGKTLATIRDGLKEENELNKISHYGVIIEDNNQDKYILISKLEGKDRRDKIVQKLWKWDIKVYQVNSFTSKALNKFIKNPLSEDAKKFHGKYKDEYGFWYENKNWDFTYKIKNVSEYDEQGKWIWYQEEFLNHIKKCLIDSEISREQNWTAFGWSFDGCNNYEEIEKEIDSKWYQLTENSISKGNLESLVKDEDCSLFPIINQDISSQKQENKNIFTLDFEKVFERKECRIHPEFSIFYRKPIEEHKKENKSWIINRFGRLQLLANLGIEFVPRNLSFKTKKEQNRIAIDQKKQNQLVQEFNQEKVNTYFEGLDNYYIFGIDRWIKQLATLCVTDKGWVIQDFTIFTKHFNQASKIWEYRENRKEWILDLTNLKIESDKNWNTYIVDISLFDAKDDNWRSTGTNKQNIQLKQLAYIRKLQYQMSANEKWVLDFIAKYISKDEREQNIKELITPYKEWKKFADLPMDIFQEMFENYYRLKTDQNLSEFEKKNLMKITTELDASENLKKWVVANMIGVIYYLMKYYDYKVKITLENLNQSFWWQVDWINNHYVDIKNNFMYQENQALAWVWTYHFFEMQLLKKIFKISTEEWILHLVPSFGSVKNYFKDIEKYSLIVNIWRNEKYNQFWVVHFVKPDNTSKKCPVCLNTQTTWKKEWMPIINRNYKKSNIFYCERCWFQSIHSHCQEENIKDSNDFHYSVEEVERIEMKNKEAIEKYKKQWKNLHFIKNGDDNAAYNIWEKIRELPKKSDVKNTLISWNISFS